MVGNDFQNIIGSTVPLEKVLGTPVPSEKIGFSLGVSTGLGEGPGFAQAFLTQGRKSEKKQISCSSLQSEHLPRTTAQGALSSQHITGVRSGLAGPRAV